MLNARSTPTRSLRPAFAPFGPRARTAGVLVLGLVLAGFSARPATAQITLGPQVSLLGIGAGASVSIGNTGLLSASGEFGFVPMNDINMSADGIDFTISPRVAGGYLSANLHPLRSSFIVSLGLYFGGYKGQGETEQLNGTVEIGNTVYPVEDVGTLVGTFSWTGTAPILAIGRAGSGFSFRLGVALTNTPKAKVVATGMLSEDPTFQQELDQEIENIQEGLNMVPFTPFLSLGWQFKLAGR